MAFQVEDMRIAMAATRLKHPTSAFEELLPPVSQAGSGLQSAFERCTVIEPMGFFGPGSSTLAD